LGGILRRAAYTSKQQYEHAKKEAREVGVRMSGIMALAVAMERYK
jgi:hypothetical protein